MGKRYNWKPVLILAIGFFAFVSTVLIGRVGAGTRQAIEPGRTQQKRRIGEVPARARAENLIAPQSQSEQIRMLLSFQLRDEAGLQQLIADLNDPASPMYHQWLTPEEFGQRFGRDEAEFNQALSWLQSQGFDVDRSYRNRLAIGFTGTVAVVERAFNVQMGLYWDSNANRPFFSNVNAPTLPPEIESITAGLDGLNDAVFYHHRASMGKATRLAQADVSQQSGHGTPHPDAKIGSTLFIGPRDFALLYNYQPLWNANIKGSGQKVGIIIDSDILDSDMTTYRNQFGLPAANLQRVLFPGFSNPGRTADGEFEADLDTMSISATAPQAEIDLILIPTLNTGSIFTVEQDVINGVGTLNIHVVSESFGTCESIFSTSEQNLFRQAVTQGIAFFASAGDEGANCDESDPTQHGVGWPVCYDGVTGVGGTVIQASFDAQGNVTARLSETAWNDPPGIRLDCSGVSTGGGASGGGVSVHEPIPAYQQSAQGFPGGVPTGTGRFVPDVAALAGSPGALVVQGGGLSLAGGTSEASPLWAGMMALINQFKGSPQGSPNAALYQLGVNQYKNGGPPAFVDITSGNNNVAPVSPCLPTGWPGFSAKTGYDAVTGWGVPDINVIANNFGGAPAPNYVGFVDQADCTTLRGWAADRNRLNTSINVEIYDGSTLIATVLANGSRPDVGAALADNGLHGFSIATPGSLKDGSQHTVHVRFEMSTTELGSSPASLTCTSAPNYVGFVDHAACDTIAGWAADRNRLNTSINVEIYDGSTLIATVLASNSRPDVGAAIGDNGLHGFNIATPASLKDGAPHTVHVRFETSTTDLTNSPVSITCTSAPPNYVGFVDQADCNAIRGWAADRNRLNTSINVEIYDGSTLIATVLASNSRPDVGAAIGDNGMHGFSIGTPGSLKTGSAHSVHVRFETSATDLTNSPMSVTCTAGPPNYVGFVDHAACDTISGWAADRNRLSTSINVEIYDGSTLIATVLASNSRPDVGAAIGDNGMHGFSIPTPAALKTSTTHTVHIRFETSATDLTNSPVSLTCP